jgi:polysaccharide biosynthesis protein VpsJ
MGVSDDDVNAVDSSLFRLERWITENRFQGYEPFDGLESFLRPLALGTKFGRQALVQLVKRCPANLRPFVGIKPATSTKGMGFMARGYLRWNQSAPSNGFQEKADYCLQWLRSNRSSGYSGPCWGNHFDYQTRTYYLAAHHPTIVWSSLIGHAFIDSFELSGKSSDLEEARGVCEFILRDLPRFTDDKGTCIGYVSNTAVLVHNANALGASLLARVYGHTREKELAETAADAMNYTVGHQREDGSWFYGERDDLHWIDNWHTAYVLDSLLDYELGTGDERFHDACQRGWRFYFSHFFLPDGRAKYYDNKTYPIDIQCASQSIETLCRFSGQYEPALSAALRVARWTIANMQDSTGYFYFQSRPLYLNRAPHFHWGQATMFSALAMLRGHLGK